MNLIRLFPLASLTLFALTATATPQIGDKAVFSASLGLGTYAMAGKATFEITGVSPDSNSWSVNSLIEISGAQEQKVQVVQAKDLQTEASIADILANCAAKGGTPELVTVPAGTFQACAVPMANDSVSGTVWIAKVPFGYVKGVGKRADGMNISGVLESYSSGAK